MKKGQYNYVMVGLIVLTIFTVITIPLYRSVQKKSDDITYHKVCMDSVALSAKFSMGHQELKCPLIETTSFATDKSAAMEEISRKMVSTWDEFHAGKPNIFKTSLYEHESFCIFRHVIKFQNADKIGNIPGSDFTAYLLNNQINRGGSDMMVLDYLSGYKTSEIDYWNLDSFNPTPIDTSTPVAVVVVYSQLESLNLVWAEIAGGSAVGGAAAGAVVVGIASLAISTGGLAIPVIIAGGVIAGTAGGIFAVESGYGTTQDHDAGILLIPYTEEAVNALDCTYLPADQSIMEVA